MAEYELHIVFRQVCKVFVDAEDDDTAMDLAVSKIREHGWNDDEDNGIFLLEATEDITIENVYE